jgi:hypothetical protein
MRLPYPDTIALWLILICSGCSSLVSDHRVRSLYLQSYLDQSVPLILYYPSQIHIDEQLKVLGINEIAPSLGHYFDTHDSTRGVIEQFVTSTAPLKEFFPLIVEPKNWDTLEDISDMPVLFFYVDWRLSYQRLPPDLGRYRLQASVVSKIIPMSQVLSKKGTIALRTAAWEGRCMFDAMAGGYYTADEWTNGVDERLDQSVETMQQLCGHTLAEQFAHPDVQR